MPGSRRPLAFSPLTPPGRSPILARKMRAAVMETQSTDTNTSELTYIHELVYELRVGDVMAANVVTVSPAVTMAELKEILREKRISGAPVVDNGALVGIISLEDLIKAMAAHRQGDTVGSLMSRSVVTVRADEPAVQAVNLFAQHGFRRIPVVNQDGALVGILTGGDITRGLLKSLSQRYKVEELRHYRASHIFEDIESDKTSLILRYQVAVNDFDRGGRASSKLKRALERLGADPGILRRIAIAAYEAEMNLVIHTTHGGELRAEISPRRIVIITRDEGPGIEDTEAAFKPGFSTAADWVRELGFGAGMGLANIKNYSDRVHLVSQPGKGTILAAVFELQKGTPEEKDS